MKQKSGLFAMLIVNHLTNVNVSFLGFYIKYVKFKHEKVEVSVGVCVLSKNLQGSLFPMKQRKMNSL